MKKLSILIGLICAMSFSITAQNSNDELLKKLVEKNVLTQVEADELKEKTGSETNISKSEKIREAFNTPYMKFGGYGLLMYRYDDRAETKHKADPRAIFISMTGKFNNFRYFILSEFVDPMLYEFYGEWAPSDAFKLKGGMMKVPYSLENQMSLTEIETIFNTRSVSNLIGMGGDVMQLQNGKNNTGRDIGIQVHGNLFPKSGHELIQYSAGIFQGTGIKLEERNDTKDFSGALYLKPMKEFRIGSSVYFGQTNYVKAGEVLEKKHVRNRWLISSDYQTDKFYARAEYIKANDGGIRKEAIYGTALYYLMPNKLNIVGKVDFQNGNRDINAEVVDYTAAVNYYFYPGCRFQLNYTYSDYNDKWGARNSNAIAAQMQIVF
ncbi:porin [Dysgonomonas sp. 520]|uniref:porin n=1 Tax=Dysgonomonas sp. 520 TaxID=2302931 RepID=UPI0013D44144|nr:porin [Dysgonomonas sp. 520]NDW09571.1 hypothetical protein [Dysgonomonas sp. 520]